MTGKKGSERLNNVIISITIVAAALAIFIAAASNADTEHRYLTDFYSHDLALLIEAAQAVPGDVTIRYPLDEGFEATLHRDEVTVRHVRTGIRQTKPYHLLAGMAIKESVSEDVVLLTKSADTLSFDKSDTAAVTSQTCPPLPDNAKEFTIRAQAGTAHPRAAHDRQELQAMTDVLNMHLQNAGLTGNQGAFLQLELSADNATSHDSIIFARPTATGKQEQAYQHLYCTLKRGLKGTGLSLQEAIGPETNGYQVEIILKLTDKQKASWDQAAFLKKIPEAWKHTGSHGGGSP